MANEEHLNILKLGVKAWNEWRRHNPEMQPDLSYSELGGTTLSRANLGRTDLSNTNLTSAYLTDVDLSHADLSHADLTMANAISTNFTGAKLIGAKLFKIIISNADLSNANLSNADLTGADLHLANFTAANLTGAKLPSAHILGGSLAEASLNGAVLSFATFSGLNLKNTNLTDATCGFNVFVSIDLSTVRGLETTKHIGPSTIGTDTLFQSRGKIPDIFLRRCGVPENLIGSLPLLLQGKVVLTVQNTIFGAPVTDHKLRCDIFMIMPFAEQFQSIYADYIKPLAQTMGYEIRRGDDFFGKRAIMSDIWSATYNAKLVIAECTGRNPNVFYELGIAHTLDKPGIMITQNIEDIPFDIRHLRHIEYKEDAKGLIKLKTDLENAIRKLLE